MSECKSLGDIIGDWGRWQTNVFLFAIVNYVLQSYNSMSFSFYAPKTNFWCADYPSSQNETLTSAEKCEKFVDCKKWVYDDNFDSTIISEWNLICNRSMLSSLTQTVFMVGYIPSGLILALVADRIGRKSIIWTSFTLEILAGISCIFSFSIWQFIISRLLLGIAVCMRGNVLFALFFESCGKKYRGDTGILLTGGWIVGFISLPGIAYFIRNFRILQAFATLSVLVLLIWSFFIDESIRWQITHNQEEEAEKTMIKAYSMNNKSNIIGDGIRRKMNSFCENIKEEAREASTANKHYKPSVLDLLRTPRIRLYTIIFWIVFPINSLVYYGISYSVGAFEGDLYLNFVISGLVEIPGMIFTLLLCRYSGRRLFTSYNMIFCGLTCLCGLIPIQSMPNFSTILLFFAKFFITNSYNVIIVQQNEIFPTVLRTAAGGSITIASRVGAMVAPFTPQLINQFGINFILTFFAFISLIGGLLTYFLPETKSIDIPDTVQGTEKIGLDNKS
ncbi:organic cation transporter protein [Tetranychus urticae]|uniref:Major facilitator superfamily (MFS) profile domain-containing protein n=1 Tax=Tetranychus urticae TaxID=32264 RepID=T1KNP5_TETUR|nr:organic cation transporter protein [Tetranychus urticae]